MTNEAQDKTQDIEHYKYTEFGDYFRDSAPFLWNVKEWDNETIKKWLEDAFFCARITIPNQNENK